MKKERVPNYLVMYRKRLGFTKQEIGFLIGRGPAYMGRIECCKRKPSFEMTMRLCALFQEPLQDLFAGECESAEQFVRKRARRLHRQLARSKQKNAIQQHKMEFLLQMLDITNGEQQRDTARTSDGLLDILTTLN